MKNTTTLSNVKNMETWIIPCNIKYYDVFGAFRTLKRIEWRQSTRVEVGDIVFVYVGQPYSAIMFKCKATKVNITDLSIDDSEFNKEPGGLSPHDRYMELQLLEEYSEDRFQIDTLRKYGLKGSIQGPRRATEKIQKLLDDTN